MPKRSVSSSFVCASAGYVTSRVTAVFMPFSPTATGAAAARSCRFATGSAADNTSSSVSFVSASVVFAGFGDV